ncbi:MAG: DUF1553 domain-containing protein [Planctomycetota bacterium]
MRLVSYRQCAVIALSFFIALGSLRPLAQAMDKPTQEIQFNQDIRPILSDMCFACHGPDEHGRQADLRLDTREDAVDFGAIDVDDPDASLILERITTDDPDLLMPPPETGKKVSSEQIRLLKQWIASGAAYERHWSLEPIPELVEPPVLRDAAVVDWSRMPLDMFVANRMVAQGYRPAKEIDRAGWLRRVTLDLTGLPPSLPELEDFLADDGDDAYELVVDRLLRSDAYGERMASMWLDVARYADTFGYQNDIEMEVWPYRDWVIRAFNENKPYDQFVLEQTAGDLLPNATQEQRLATTFNRLHRQTNEGGSVVEEFRQANIADRTATNATAFLGLTFDCARCHDHKYDPIRQRDFYQLAAYFADIDELGLYAHFTRAVPSPAMLLYQGDEADRHEAIQRKVKAAREEYERVMEQSTRFWTTHADRLPGRLPESPTPDHHFALEAESEGVVGKAKVFNGDDAFVCEGVDEFGRHDPFTFALWVKPALEQERMVVLHQSVAAEDSGFRGLEITLDRGHLQSSLIHFWPGNAARVRSSEVVPINTWSHIAVTHDGTGTAAGLRLYVNGRQVARTVIRDQLTRDILHRKEWGDMKAGAVSVSLGARFRDIGFRDGAMDDLMVYRRDLSVAEIMALHNKSSAAIAKEKNDGNDGDGETNPNAALTESLALEHQLQVHDHPARDAWRSLLAALREENEFVTGLRAIMTMRTAKVSRPVHVLERGEYGQPGERVEPGTPSFLFQDESYATDRLGLARWLIDERNPLLARVAVNRFWHMLFGRGIVATLEDFGSQGRPPSHPRLLDRLARDFMNDGWDVKAFCKRIVLSATYRQSSQPADPDSLASDAANVWLARGPKHRLSAEQIRDVALYASGLMVQRVGGPSVKPYQPAGLWKESGTGKRYTQSQGEGLYRRSLYTFWKRTAPPPAMLTFDATSRETCTARRELTTTPLQALVLLNDVQYVEAARVLAEQLVAEFPSSDSTLERWDNVFRRLVGRPPSRQQRAIVERLYRDQLAMFEKRPEDATKFVSLGDRPAATGLPASDVAATGVVVEMLFSYDETMMKR